MRSVINRTGSRQNALWRHRAPADAPGADGGCEHRASRRIPVELGKLAGQSNEMFEHRAGFEPGIDLVGIVGPLCRERVRRFPPALNGTRTVAPGTAVPDDLGDQLVDL